METAEKTKVPEVKGVEEKVLISPDVEKIITNIIKGVLPFLVSTTKTDKNEQTKKIYFDEKGLHVEILKIKENKITLSVCPFDQLNRIMEAMPK